MDLNEKMKKLASAHMLPYNHKLCGSHRQTDLHQTWIQTPPHQAATVAHTPYHFVIWIVTHSIPPTTHHSASLWTLPYGLPFQYFSATPVGAHCALLQDSSQQLSHREGGGNRYMKRSSVNEAWLRLATEQTRKCEREDFSQCLLRRANLCSILVTYVLLMSSEVLYESFITAL